MKLVWNSPHAWLSSGSLLVHCSPRALGLVPSPQSSPLVSVACFLTSLSAVITRYLFWEAVNNLFLTQPPRLPWGPVTAWALARPTCVSLPSQHFLPLPHSKFIGLLEYKIPRSRGFACSSLYLQCLVSFTAHTRCSKYFLNTPRWNSPSVNRPLRGFLEELAGTAALEQATPPRTCTAIRRKLMTGRKIQPPSGCARTPPRCWQRCHSR